MCNYLKQESKFSTTPSDLKWGTNLKFDSNETCNPCPLRINFQQRLHQYCLNVTWKKKAFLRLNDFHSVLFTQTISIIDGVVHVACINIRFKFVKNLNTGMMLSAFELYSSLKGNIC